MLHRPTNLVYDKEKLNTRASWFSRERTSEICAEVKMFCE